MTEQVSVDVKYKHYWHFLTCSACNHDKFICKHIAEEYERLKKENDELKRTLAFNKPLQTHFDVQTFNQLMEENQRLKRLDENVKNVINNLRAFLFDAYEFKPIAEKKIKFLEGLYKENTPDINLF